jgi:hypothetical protein
MRTWRQAVIAKMKALGFCCSFCGRSKGEVENIMAGSPPRNPGISGSVNRKSAFICNECVRRYYQLVSATEITKPVAAPK